MDIPGYFYAEGLESLKLTYQLSLIFQPSAKCQTRIKIHKFCNLNFRIFNY